MTLSTVDALLIAIGFLVPGFVWSAVVSLFLPRRTRETNLRFLEFLTLSCLNHGLWSWALLLVLKTPFHQTQPGWTAMILFAIIFVSPVLLGLVSAGLRRADAVAKLLGRFGFHAIQPEPTAWDRHFFRAKPYWVVVTLRDGGLVYGLYFTRSFAGDEPGERDLYLEMQCRRTETGAWTPIKDSGGVLIKAEQIALIEFRRISEFDYD